MLLFVTQCTIGPRYFYLVWTTIWAIFHFTSLLLVPYYRTVLTPYPEPWTVHLPNWSYLVLVITSVSDCVATIIALTKRKGLLAPSADEVPAIPWFMQLVWLLYNTANVSVLTATLLLRVIIPFRTDLSSILVQVVSPVYVTMNIFVCGKETRLLHVYQPFCFIFLYMLTNAVYTLTSGSRIYPLLNWSGSPIITIAISMGILMTFVPLLHVFVYGVFRLRTYVIDRCKRETVEDPPATEPNQ
ncbi:uncharacterized protein LOC130048365 isoform X4 [Ostrea edulis]|uniref:uncharacterized protein LOC130048365 isoform X4 n=1 Tax=Ostrea edulis TaxID=37623 RepID=UPI0024AEEF86|nr:uncharacterized protein LOC130048365 isoform X4 [Ostrea edulis]